MFEAQMLVKGSPATEVYSPWFPRQGDSMRCTLDLISRSAGTLTILTVNIFTKNREDPGDGDNADSSTNFKIDGSMPGRYAVEGVSKGTIGIEELVRYKFTVGGPDAASWVLFRMLPPVWFDSVLPA